MRTPVVDPDAKVLAEAALLPAPEVVGDAERRDGQDARLRDCHDPADEREPQAAVVRRLRAEGEDDVAKLAAAVHEAGKVAPGRPVLELELGLADRELRLRGVRGHRRLAAEAGREREDGVTRLLRQRRWPESGSRAV